MASWTTEHLAPSTLPNTKVPWKTIKEEQQYREEFMFVPPAGSQRQCGRWPTPCVA